MKRTFILLAVGGLTGMVIATFAVPSFLSWWAAPVVPGDPCACTGKMEWAMSRFAIAQASLGGILAVLFALFGAVFSKKLKDRAAKRQLQSPAPTPPTTTAGPG